MTNWIFIGRATKTHGLKGEVSVQLASPENHSLQTQKEIKLEGQNSQEVWQVDQVFYGNKVRVLFSNKTIHDVEKLLPCDLFMQRQDLPEPLPGEFYGVDLVGLEVLSDGQAWGKVESFYHNEVQLVLQLKSSRGEVLELPFVPVFFPRVDCEKQQIDLILPEEI